LLAHAPDPIFAIDAQGGISFANAEALRVSRRPRHEVVGQTIDAIVPGLNLRNISVGPGESLLPLPDVELGERIYSPSIRVLPSDNAAETTVALRDVTERRKAEARRLDYYSIIAHDLRSPITSILLRIERILRGKYGVLHADLIADLRRMEGSLRSQVAMINDFLELARLEGVGYKVERRPLDVAELVRSTMDDFRPLFEDRRLTWRPIGLDASAMISGDRERLAQVFSNLVSNAIKFTEPPGVITTDLSITDDQVELSVADTGQGIAPDQLQEIFERYTRPPDEARHAPGTGLGLMIVRELVEAHGGVVGVESQLGVGSRFWLRLPRCSARVTTA
jgi:signal transduction histidine kinase